jgi:spore germination protein YaaH
MRRMIRPAGCASVAVLLCITPLAAQRGERLFYYVDREDSYNSLVEHISRIDVLAPSAFFVDEDGVVYGDVDARVLALARQHRVDVMPLLVNRGFDQEKLSALLADDDARARIVASLVELCRRHRFAGIQIDFENLSLHDRNAFTRFYREVAGALRPAGYRVSVAVVHRPDELAGPTAYHEWLFDSWRGGYDLEALARASDFISVMTYSQHTRRTPPGPQAGLPWTEQVVQYFLRFVPPEKLSVGVALGSQHWYTSYEERVTPELARSYSQQLSYRWALGVIERNGGKVRWDDEHHVAYSFFPVGGTFEWIFLEEARSFRAKLALVNRYHLRGFSAWLLGPEDPAIWDALQPRLRP